MGLAVTVAARSTLAILHVHRLARAILEDLRLRNPTRNLDPNPDSNPNVDPNSDLDPHPNPNPNPKQEEVFMNVRGDRAFRAHHHIAIMTNADVIVIAAEYTAGAISFHVLQRQVAVGAGSSGDSEEYCIERASFVRRVRRNLGCEHRPGIQCNHRASQMVAPQRYSANAFQGMDVSK